MPASYLSGRKFPLALCYHAVSNNLRHPLAVTPQSLREQVDLLAAEGYRSVTFSELEDLRGHQADADRVVAITFDDGYASTMNALEILGERGFVATVYVLPTTLGTDEPLRWRGIERLATGPNSDEMLPMGWSDVERLRDAGWEIGSHTLSHPRLRRLDDDRLDRELRESRELLAERFGECRSVAYPFGSANNRVARAARQAGYENGATLSRWHRRDDPHLRPRVGIYFSDSLSSFRHKIAPWSRVVRALAIGPRQRTSS